MYLNIINSNREGHKCTPVKYFAINIFLCFICSTDGIQLIQGEIEVSMYKM